VLTETGSNITRDRFESVLHVVAGLRLLPGVPEGPDDFGARWLLAPGAGLSQSVPAHVGEVMLITIPVDVARAD
jgi:hypothetical protein